MHHFDGLDETGSTLKIFLHATAAIDMAANARTAGEHACLPHASQATMKG